MVATDFQLDAPTRAATFPFSDAFAPMRAFAIEAGGMREDLADAMIQELSRNFSQALFARFVQTRDYRGFVDRLLNGGWRDLFVEYPVLERLIDYTVSAKIEEARELNCRLEADLPALRAFFG